LLAAAALLVVLLVVTTALTSVLAAISPDAALAAKTQKVSYAATIRDGRTAARSLLKQTGAASLSLALIKNNKVVWRQSFGYADKATSTRPTAITMYGIGSISKMFATMAVMKLVDQGRVSLDAPVTRYIPDFTMLSPAYRQITVRMLLDHSSGFEGSEYRNGFGTAYIPGFLDQTMQSLAQQRLKHTPGLLNVYCNDGFTVVEKLVLNVTGRSFVDFVQDEIFDPLGMKHSAYPVRAFAAGSWARCYTGDEAHPFEVLSMLGAGGLYSTPTDLGRVATMLMNNGSYRGTRVLKAASVREMGRDQTVRSFDPMPSAILRYGLGWDTVREPGLAKMGVTAWVKGGDSIDYHAGFIVAPKAKLAIAVTGVAPLSSTLCEDLGERILLKALVSEGVLRRMPRRLPQTTPKPKRATSTQLNAMKGYWADYGSVRRITSTPGKKRSLTMAELGADGWTTTTASLRLRSDGRFHANRRSTGFTVTRGGARTYLNVNLIGGYGHFRYDLLISQKLQPRAPLSATWQARLGSEWLAVNDMPDSSALTMDRGPVLALRDVPGLPGYLAVGGIDGYTVLHPDADGDAAYMFLQIPGMASRDLYDLKVEEHSGEEWLQYGSTLYRQKATVPDLAAGANAVTVDAEGNAEWRRLPSGASLTIDAGTAWHLYDSDLKLIDSGTAFPATGAAPSAGCYLLLHGPAGSTSTVTLTP
jgi:CubicO group peptidase (beta-lactamase class C family)